MSEPVTNPSQPVLVTFDREVKGETVNEFTFRLEDDFGPVPAKIQYLRNRRQAVLAPIGLLESGKRYRVVATQGIVDLAGKPLARPWTSAFVVQSPVRGPAAPQMSAQATPNRAPAATHSGPQDPEFAAESGDAMSGADAQEDLAALGQLDNAPSPAPRTAGSPARSAAAPRRERLETVKVLGVWPSNGATEVPRDCRIRMKFNQQMDPNTITAINIALFGRETRVEGSVKYDPNSREVTFVPVEPLYPDTEYKIVMSDKIRSISGEPMVQRYRWAFTTTQASLSNYARLQAPRTQRTGFSIPLADKKRAARPVAAKAPAGNDGSWAAMSAMLRGNGNANNANSFPLLKSGHWAFKTINHLKGVGLLANNPFPSTAKVTRYEMAMAVNSALTNLNTLRQSAHPPRIALNDLIQLEHLIVEFRTELKSIGIDVNGFEGFLTSQGVQLQEIENRVQKLNQRMG